MFSKYAAQHATGVRTADILIASAPGLWVGAADNGFLQPFTPAGISDYPAFTSQGKGLYVFSPDPAITIYNKVVLKGQPAPSTVAQIAQDGIEQEVQGRDVHDQQQTSATSAFCGYVHQKGWAALDKLGQTAQTPGDGDVLGAGRRPGRIHGSGLRVRARPRPDRNRSRRQASSWDGSTPRTSRR